MAADHLVDVKRFLANSFLHASPEWVEGCVDFFVSEHQNERYTCNDLKEFVLEQWKLADLREMGQGCFPPNLCNIVKITLPGKYAVQVEWIRNVGQSAYSQLQNMRKQVNENTEVGTNAPQAWEPKPTRMLQLSLCDGKQIIKGMEYRPIRVLNNDLLPGFKLLIVGPVECRRGNILLQEHNLQIIGGEIDTLLIPNAIENVLARTLNLEPNPDPYKTQPDHGTSTQMSSHIRNSEPSTALNFNTNVAPGRRDDRNQVLGRNAEEEFLHEDILMNDAEMDAQLLMLERQNQEELENVNINEAEEDIDDLEQKYLGEIQNIDFEDTDFNSAPQPLASEETAEQNNDTSHFLDDDDDDFLCQMSFEALEKTSDEIKPPKINMINSKQNPHYQIKSTGQTGKSNQLKPKSTKPQTHSTSNKQSKITSFLNKSSENSDSGIETASTSKFRNERNYLDSGQTKNSIENKSLSSEFVVDLKDWQNDDFETSKYSEKKALLDIKDSTRNGKGMNKESPVITDPEPFVYLSQINIPVDFRKVYTVKAFVMTLLSQLKFGKEGWQLNVKLCDGSSNMDVKLSSDVLEKLIGFSATEMHAIRRDVPKNPLLKDKLKNILQNAQQRLINLNCLLKIEFLPDSEIPCVIDIEEIAEHHLQALQARLDYAYAQLIS